MSRARSISSRLSSVVSTLATAAARCADRRAAIDAEIEEEFAHHLELIERDLIAAGADPAAARREALARFGDIPTLHARCRRIALKEQIMLERINTVALVLVVAGMVYLAVRVENSQARTAAAITAIAQNLQPPPAAPQRPVPAPTAERARTAEPVYLGAGVANPGAYLLSDSNASLRRTLITAGGVTLPGGAEVVVVRADNTAEVLTAEEFTDPTGRDIMLRPGDRVEVR